MPPRHASLVVMNERVGTARTSLGERTDAGGSRSDARRMEAPYQVAVGGASVIDRHRALQHFGSEGVMDSLLQRFPETVRNAC